MGKLLEEALADESGVPRRAAGHYHYPLDVKEFILEMIHSVEKHLPAAVVYASADAVADGGRLLHYLLEHEMVVSPFLKL